MSNWTLEVHLCELFSNKTQVITQDGSDVEKIVLELARLRARFIYAGVKYISDPPWVDPIAKKIIYYCEGYRDS